jgi:hypothetical protein
MSSFTVPQQKRSTGGTSFGAYDPTAPFTSPFLQPAFGMCLVTGALVALTQAMPHEFLPTKYIGTVVGGAKAERWIVLPGSLIAVGYAAVAAQVDGGDPLTGHTIGMGLSQLTTVCCVAARRISPWYWVFGLGFALYSYLHHRRRIRMLTDGAPWYVWGDWTRVRETRRAAKAAARSLKDDAPIREAHSAYVGRQLERLRTLRPMH